MNQTAPAGGTSILRLRAGFLVLVALIIVSVIAGRWMAALFSLGMGWAAALGLLVAVLIGTLLTRLDTRAYVAVAILVTLVAAYTAYDFARGPIDWSPGWALALALIPVLALGAAFWDFRHLTHELRVWAHREIS